MRFRPKFDHQMCLRILSLCAWIFIMVTAIAERKPTLMATLAATWIVMLIAQIGASVFVTWSIDPGGLRKITAWSSEIIPYTEIVAVHPHVGLRKPSRSQIDIDYGKLGSALNPRRTIIANPRERAAFLETVHAHTPQAAFDL